MKAFVFAIVALAGTLSYSAPASAHSDHWWRVYCMGFIQRGEPLPGQCYQYVNPGPRPGPGHGGPGWGGPGHGGPGGGHGGGFPGGPGYGRPGRPGHGPGRW